MTVTFPKVTHQDLYDHIFGACFDTYGWWGIVRKEWDGYDAPDWWTVALHVEDPDNPGEWLRRVVSPDVLLGTIRDIAQSTTHGEWVSRSCEAECVAFLEDPDTADFDADTADQVMQVATLGEVVYG